MNIEIIRRESDTSLPLLERIFHSRGLNEANTQFSLKALLDIQALKGLGDACDLLVSAIHQQQKILVLGDFDVDGATSTALAVDALRQMGAQDVSYLVPNRFEFGYGLSVEIVDYAYQHFSPDLIVTVDNGISSFEGVTRAQNLGIKVLVTDHHLAADSLPTADAIVNPNQPDCGFASKSACGCAVIFYVMCALRTALIKQGHAADSLPNMAQYLDLVALATVADVVPLDENNRILVEQGLRRIRSGYARPGIQALLTVAKKNPSQLTSKDFGFALGPRLNAAGRMDDMSVGIECLLAQTLDRALMIAQSLDELNQDRKLVEGQMQQEALTHLERLSVQADDKVSVCLYQGQWHQGVIGLLASRIKEKLYRPVIAFAPAQDGLTDAEMASGEFELKGSGRSIPGFHLRDALDLVAKQIPHVLNKFGGHAMAAGLSIKQKHLMEFEQAFELVAKKLLTPELLINQVVTDGAPAPQDFNINLARQLRFMAPWGQNFPEPLFDETFTVINHRLLGMDKNHLKLTLQIPNSHLAVDAILFGIERHGITPAMVVSMQRVHVVFEMDVNEFRGQESVQLIVRHLQAV
ncbi:single-stranded-DNA-specific exonuclease RecJ [Bermanella sp. WJH001]|uniref:single-stranded-DNA-specific exonuclease RecJ n=1 Tax=Bermanella sp. WJH001 TaxID=3048005 RepID=UPI0024BED04D|nr:single-stranded-DNA-specific exonuclease RecJ [Bermanella sp. WJH001]MDJ1538240.1 single-stranded-DNA-specific exonuclease RecJ [Bermanella sp. WJH001]